MRQIPRQRVFALTLTSLFLGASLLSLPMWADSIPERIITTQGHSEIKTRPDALNISVSVETQNAVLKVAQNENNQKIQAIIQALKALNIPNLKLETQNVRVSPIQDYQNRKLPKVTGYQVQNTLNVMVTNALPDELGNDASKIIDTATNQGANHVNGPSFYLSNMTAVRQQALEAAVRDARNNAEAMAHAAGVAITGLHSLEGTPQFGSVRPVFYAMKAAGVSDSVSTPVEAGETTVTSDVTARFKF